MTTKKKKKNTMDAIDKYLLQKRYSEGKKYEKKETSTKKVIQIVVPKVSNELLSTLKRSEEKNRRSARSVRTKVSVSVRTSLPNRLRKLKPEKNDSSKQSANNVTKSLKVALPKLPKRVIHESSRTKVKTVEIPASGRTRRTNKRNLRVNGKELYEDKGKNVDKNEISNKKAANGERVGKNLKKTKKPVRAATELSNNKKFNNKNSRKHNSPSIWKNSKTFKKATRTAKTVVTKINGGSYMKNPIGNLADDDTDSKRAKKVPVIRRNSCDSQQQERHEVTGTLRSINETIIVSRDNNIGKDFEKKTLKNVDCCLPKKKRKLVIEETETAKTNSSDEPCCSYNDVASSLQSGNVDTEITEEITPITKKYQPYMERLKQLSSDVIKKYIKDNQQYYVNYKKEIESKTANVPVTGKKMKKYDEMRESFKCNPFNSDQQLAMYYTLREIFDVPKTHFMECRNLFTVLLPEISCQLFAETFRIKVSFAPRLIKKLYPNPVCPV